MKRFLSVALMAILLLSLTACSAETDLTGVWEQEMEISILGVEENTSAASIARFIFREDGTGTQEQIIPDRSYPDAIREFTWQMEKETLTLDYGENQMQTFVVALKNGSLKLESSRGTFDLTKVE